MVPRCVPLQAREATVQISQPLVDSVIYVDQQGDCKESKMCYNRSRTDQIEPLPQKMGCFAGINKRHSPRGLGVEAAGMKITSAPPDCPQRSRFPARLLDFRCSWAFRIGKYVTELKTRDRQGALPVLTL